MTLSEYDDQVYVISAVKWEEWDECKQAVTMETGRLIDSIVLKVCDQE